VKRGTRIGPRERESILIKKSDKGGKIEKVKGEKGSLEVVVQRSHKGRIKV